MLTISQKEIARRSKKLFTTYILAVIVVWLILLNVLIVRPEKKSELKVIEANDPRTVRVIDWKDERTVKVKEKIKPTRRTSVSAYTARACETDSSPTTTASGQKVREGIVAMNGVPFGTKVYIEGMGIYEVQDRMAKKNNGKIDIFMWDLGKARQFGRRNLNFSIIK